jgi:hypothetical protein
MPTELRHSGSIHHKELVEYSDEELLRIVISAASTAGAARTIEATPEATSPDYAALGRRIAHAKTP